MRPLKRLGQHFLTDPALLRRIVDALDPHPTDVVLEIGPGRGSLTEHLLARVGRVIAIEKDRRLAEALRASYVVRRESATSIVAGDALRVDWHELLRTTHDAPRTGFKVAGNIPYNITSPLIDKALTPPLPACVVFLVQREVAERLAAAPGSRAYGALSIGVQAVCRVELLFTVHAAAFRPPPKVTSAVVRLTPLAAPLVRPEEVPAFRAFVTRCFTRRRKQLRNVVVAASGRDAATVASGLERLGLDPAARPERLAPADFVRLLRWAGQL